jgi:hypothetical protein
MYTIEVLLMLGDIWIAQLFHNGNYQQWFPCKSSCQEHAEAEAAERWPFAAMIS